MGPSVTARRGAIRSAIELAVEHGVDDFYQGVVPALVPLLVAVRHYDLTRAGGIVLAATVLSSVAQPAFGVLADRHRAAWLRTAGLALAATGIGAVGLVGSYLGTWVAVLASGLGIAAYHPEAARAVHATGTGDRGMGWFTFGGLAGFALGPPVTAAVLGVLGLAATPLLVVPAVAVVVATLVRAGRSSGRAAVPSTASPVDRPTVTAGDDRRSFAWLTALVMTRSVLYYGLTAFLAVYLGQRSSGSATVAALAVTALTGVGALSVLTSDVLTRRLGRVRTLVVCYLAAGVAFAALLGTDGTALAVVLAAVLGAALNLPVPVHTTLGQGYLPNHVGLAAAVTLGLAVSTGGLVSPAIGALADHAGIGTAMLALLGLPFLAAALAVPLLAHRRRSLPSRAPGG